MATISSEISTTPGSYSARVSVVAVTVGIVA